MTETFKQFGSPADHSIDLRHWQDELEQDVFCLGAKPSLGIQVPCSLAAKAAGLKTRSFIVNSLRYVAHTYGIIAGIPTVPRYHGTVGTVDSPSLYLRYTVR